MDGRKSTPRVAGRDEKRSAGGRRVGDDQDKKKAAASADAGEDDVSLPPETDMGGAGDGDQPSISIIGDGSTIAVRSGDVSTHADIRQVDLSEEYELVQDKPIGRGGMGTVYLVRHKALRQLRVIKRLHSDQQAAREGIARFLNEARTIAQLNHQNILHVYDICRDNQGFFIIMEYVDGGDLHRLIRKRGRLEPKQAMRAIEAVGKALSYAHRRRVIHRDIKPSNILLTKDGTPKVADFGLAMLGAESDLSRTGHGLGTLAYMPPEQKRDASRADHRADIYALGKTFYHMLTGKSPDTIRESEVPEQWRTAILKAIEEDVADRYFMVDQFLSDLAASQPAPVTQEAIEEGTCPECGKLNSRDTRFCGKCGAGLFESCPKCQEENRVGLSYCGKCGANIAEYRQAVSHAEAARGFLGQKQYGKALEAAKAALAIAKDLEAAREVINAIRKRREQVQELRKEAAELVETKEYERARTILQEASKIDPRDGDTGIWLGRIPELMKQKAVGNHLERAQQALEANDPELCLDECQHALKLDGQNEKATALKARAEKVLGDATRLLKDAKHQMENKDLMDARVAARSAQQLLPMDKQVASLVGELDGRLERFGRMLDRARESYEAGDCFAAIEQWHKAAKVCILPLESAEKLAAAEEKVRTFDAHMRDGKELAAQGRLKAATVAYKKALALFPESLDAREELAECRARRARRMVVVTLFSLVCLALLSALCILGYDWFHLRKARQFVAQDEFGQAAQNADRLLYFFKSRADELKVFVGHASAFTKEMAAHHWQEASIALLAAGKAAETERQTEAVLRLHQGQHTILLRSSEFEQAREACKALSQAFPQAKCEDYLAKVHAVELLLQRAEAASKDKASWAAKLLLKDALHFCPDNARALDSRKSVESELAPWPPQAFEIPGVAKDQYGNLVTRRNEAGLIPGWSGSPPQPAPSKTLDNSYKLTDSKVGLPCEIWLKEPKIEFVLIPPGRFQMGSKYCPDEKPVHTVQITRPFYLSKYEVTQEQWRAVTSNEPWANKDEAKPNPRHAASYVSWEHCHEFLGKLSVAGARICLPTEAQWEYACRAGTVDGYCFGDSSGKLAEHAWYAGNARDAHEEYAHPVGQKKPNAWGLYDMHGNVWEWCQDWYEKDYYAKSAQEDPEGPTDGKNRVLRGGSSADLSGDCLSSNRYSITPSLWSPRFGLRCCIRDF